MMSARMRGSPLLLALVLAGCAATSAARRVSDDPHPPSPTATPTASATAKARGAATQDVGSILPGWGVARIDAEMRARLVGRNWHPGCPVGLHDLRVVTVRYLGFDGQTHAGPLVLNERVADDVLWVFRRLYRHDFPIKRVALARKWHPIRRRDWFDTHDV